MHIRSVSIRNVLGARRVDLLPSTAITLIAGFNGAAKSSIGESIRMAFTGETERVDLKKQYPLLVTDGAKTGTVFVSTDLGDASFALPAGTSRVDGDLDLGIPEALPFVLNAQGFADLSTDDRRTFLYSLTNCEVSAE